MKYKQIITLDCTKVDPKVIQSIKALGKPAEYYFGEKDFGYGNFSVNRWIDDQWVNQRNIYRMEKILKLFFNQINLDL
mgnify:CR=1 FL=1